ncbi:DUF4397 domain-containing protein [Algoriphagus sp. PAP.12]|uniref:DUF4397 domain-containing protein n=1 Tax=Algoriphagus sp. PAP.12 TaxID=2996678 RepID=UPI00227B66E1|nr:DUF4397 domain-containing protein [Algoriphagus sp. PAP.12]
MLKSLTSLKKLKSKSLMAAGILSTTVLMTGCLDDLETPETPPAAYISIYQGSPDAPAMDIYANANKVNNYPLNYSEVLAYSPFYIGERTFKFSTFNSATSLLEKDFTLEEDAVYSMYVMDEVDNLNAILVEDSWNDPVADSAQVRLIHLSPDTDEVYLKITEVEDPITGSVAFGSATEFSDVISDIYTVEVKSVETDETLLTANSIELRGNRVYTFVLKGLSTSTEATTKRDLQLITNYINYY